MSRKYVNNFQNVTVTAAQDLATISLANNGYAEVIRFWVMCTDTALPAAQQLSFRCKVLTGATLGSAGTSNAAVPIDQGDTAAGCTCHQNDTTQATGTAHIVWEGACYAYQGLDIVLSESVPVNSIGTITDFVFELLSTPSGTIHLSGGIEFLEKGIVGS
jgi:hypothetical protein